MSVILKTKTPRKLIKSIREAIDQGRICSWRYDSDGDFTSTHQGLENVAWMHPVFTKPKEEVVLAMLGRYFAPVTTYEYAKYHALFTQLILEHFDEEVDEMIVTSRPTRYDKISPEEEV